MRPITRRVLALLALLCVGLLALGALPSYLGTGDPYYLTAEETDASGPAVNVTQFSAQQYPYLATALEEGRSDGYQRGQFGLKESFTHSPFDERDALATRQPDAERENRVLVEYDGTRYWVAVEQE
ncbi:hypothetical protein AUR64_13425 [Haloprofundus marisrubri]|uniref:Uncharacterized protein n=1 Tax=Haloprofundus marisrubri TaxID=1514971 RepID=A0A0W1R698_9EURY|nr:hypothetical protein [Haloprofundus marisrubri]KTG08815.1 hypothetical protein AUR64_13425 [Haloprofundus marisrubri]